MEISGTVTITLQDYNRLRQIAGKGTQRLAQHEELLDKFSNFITNVVYDSEVTPEFAEKIVAEVRAMSRSLPGIDFFADSENHRIIIKLREMPENNT